jgi:hypothetical protein
MLSHELAHFWHITHSDAHRRKMRQISRTIRKLEPQ